MDPWDQQVSPGDSIVLENGQWNDAKLKLERLPGTAKAPIHVRAQTAGQVVLSGATDLLVTGNVFAGLDPPAVDHKGDQPSVIANNYFIETDADIPTESIEGPTFDRNRSTKMR